MIVRKPAKTVPSFQEEKSALRKEFQDINKDLRRNLKRWHRNKMQLNSVDKNIFPAKYFEILKEKKNLKHRIEEKAKKRDMLVLRIRKIEKRQGRRLRRVFVSPQKA